MEPPLTETTTRPGAHWDRAGVFGTGALLCLAGLRTLSLREDLEPGYRLAALAALTNALLLLAALAWASCERRPLKERLGLAPGLAGPGSVLLLVLGVLGLSLALDQLIRMLDLRAMSQLAQYDAALEAAPESAWPWLILGLAIAPGIGEEIFFRGLLQRGLRSRLGRIGAVVVTSAIFGTVHGDPVHAAGAFGLGLYLGAVAEMTGGTRAAIACHVINNLAAVSGAQLPLTLPPEVLVAVGLCSSGFALWGARRILTPPRRPS